MKKILVILLISLISISGCSLIDKECPTCEKCSEEKALLDVSLVELIQNELDNEESLFSYYVFNYGYIEAKNVEVMCIVKETGTDNTIFSTKELIGNVASTSTKFGQIIERVDIPNIENYYGLCYVSNCDGCEILANRIPEIKREIS